MGTPMRDQYNELLPLCREDVHYLSQVGRHPLDLCMVEQMTDIISWYCDCPRSGFGDPMDKGAIY